MSDLISRQEAIDAIVAWTVEDRPDVEMPTDLIDRITGLPSAQPKLATNLQQSCNQLATDCISRQAAIDALDEIEAEVADGYGYQYAKWREYFVEMPSAQPEPKEGHWILRKSPDGGEQYECSECGVLWEFIDGTPEDNEAYFCPKCGAKMDEEEESNHE